MFDNNPAAMFAPAILSELHHAVKHQIADEDAAPAVQPSDPEWLTQRIAVAIAPKPLKLETDCAEC